MVLKTLTIAERSSKFPNSDTDQKPPLNVLQINGYESPGRRFHGLALKHLFNEHGIRSEHFVWEKDTTDPSVHTLSDERHHDFNDMLRAVERDNSIQNILYTNGQRLLSSAEFQNADIVHWHIIHSQYLSLLDLSLISSRKPTVWTIHDPWAVTGHCIYPMDCNKWMSECDRCPDLSVHFPMLKDNTNLMFNTKRDIYKDIDAHLVVASPWMETMVASSPLLGSKPISRIPFGIDLDFFSDSYSLNARTTLGIQHDEIVICFRSIDGHFKGMKYIVEALRHIKSNQKICLLTMNTIGLLDEFASQFRIVELGWLNDDALIRDALAACDFFLMPSTAEAFGVMAIEAMACGKPVISFDGTSLPEVIAAPDAGISVPMRDATALARAIQRLIDDPSERTSRGRKCRHYAEQNYGQDLHVERMSTLYRSIRASH